MDEDSPLADASPVSSEVTPPASRFEVRADRLEWDADLFDALATFYDTYATSYRGSRSDPHNLTEEDAGRLLYITREGGMWRKHSECCREDAELLRLAARTATPEDTQRERERERAKRAEPPQKELR